MNTRGLVSTLSICAFLFVGCVREEGGSGSEEENNDASGTPSLFNGGDGTTVGGTGSGLSCSGIIECFDRCGADDQSCYDGCFSDGTTSAQDQLVAMDSCATNSNCQDWDCVSHSCQVEVSACQGGGGGGGGGGSGGGDPGIDTITDGGETTSGTLSCSGIYDCYDRCSDTDDACFEDCYYSGTSTAQQLVYNMYECGETSRCQDWDCMDQHCTSLVDSCFGGGSTGGTGGSGELGCNEIIDCFNPCAPEDQACFEDCLNRGAPQALDTLIALSDCLEAAGCQDDACVQNQCGQEAAACFQ